VLNVATLSSETCTRNDFKNIENKILLRVCVCVFLTSD
jgi:hypothetical protein